MPKVKSSRPPKQEEIKCGVVMPISEIDGRSAEHWIEVLAIIREAFKGTIFRVALVSDAPESGIIHDRIINHLADDPILICDVSAKNPNVMFELGLRLAFDKATVVINSLFLNEAVADIGGEARV